IDFTFGDDEFNIKTGLHYDAASRFIQGSDGSALWENFTCRGGWTEDSADPRPGCRGVPGSQVPNSELHNYLIASEAGFISVDYDRIFADTNYQSFLDQAGPGNGSATGAQSGSIDEETSALYIEASGTSEVLNRPLRYNLGLRYINT